MKADSTQPIATPVRYDALGGFFEDATGRLISKLELINSHAALTQQVADLQQQVERLEAQLAKARSELTREFFNKQGEPEKHDG
jgi:uncharacterized small protein (DUF1192 family)